MKHVSPYIIILCLVLPLTSCSNKAGGDDDSLPVVRKQYVAECHLSGRDIAKEYRKVYLYRADQNAFMHKEKPAATFSVKDGRFDGTVSLDTTLVYQLFFTVPHSGYGTVCRFVPAETGVSFIGPNNTNADCELISETPENKCLQGYIDSFISFQDSLLRQSVADLPSVSGLYWILFTMESADKNPEIIQPWMDVYDNTYAALFPEHPYHSMILALTGNQKGDIIRDFSLPDVNGDQHKLSDLTAGKIAVVDFWASWCGSCRNRSKALIPVYEKYAGDDFTVVGVALEYKNDAAWRKALDRDGYPWINLIALDAVPSLKANHSKVFVLDRDGTILAIGPTAEELDTLLQEKLQH